MFRALLSAARERTAPYSALEARAYDRLIAPAGMKVILPSVTPFLQALPATTHLLDVGCGGAHLLAQIATEHPAFHLQGIDLSPDQVALARERTAPFTDRVDIQRASALQLPFPDATFDAALSIASIKHWPDWHQGLREIVRVLRPGAPFFVLEADRGCTLEQARHFAALLGFPPPLRRALLPLFRTFVLGIGWEIDEVRNLAAKLPLSSKRVTRLEELPMIVLEGTK